ncbi:unnamed protein product, partial [Prorocentrum cordatum]
RFLTPLSRTRVAVSRAAAGWRAPSMGLPRRSRTAGGLGGEAGATPAGGMPIHELREVIVDGKSDGNKATFRVPIHLELVKKVGSGAYGCVASFKDARTGEKFAVKKVSNAFDDLVDGKRILREVKLLRQLDHDNIIRILDMFPPPGPDFEDIYIVTDLMETDLHRVIYSKQPLTEEREEASADGNVRNGPAFESQTARRRPVTGGMSYHRVTESRPDGSGSFWLRSGKQGSLASACQAACETGDVLAGHEAPNPTPAAAAPWMAFFFVWVSVMGLYLKGPCIDSTIRQCPDFLWTDPPGIAAEPEPLKCPPGEICTRVAGGMWKVLRMPWGGVGNALLGGLSAATLDDTMRMPSPEHSPRGLYPLFVRDHGLTAYNFSTRDRAEIKLPADQPAAPRASDMAGHIGKVAEALQRACCRVSHVLTAWSEFEIKASSWVAARGGCGGDICDPMPVATLAEAYRAALRRRLDETMASTDPANEEQKQIISDVRRARALYVTGNNDEYRELNEESGILGLERDVNANYIVQPTNWSRSQAESRTAVANRHNSFSHIVSEVFTRNDYGPNRNALYIDDEKARFQVFVRAPTLTRWGQISHGIRYWPFVPLIDETKLTTTIEGIADLPSIFA